MVLNGVTFAADCDDGIEANCAVPTRIAPKIFSPIVGRDGTDGESITVAWEHTSVFFKEKYRRIFIDYYIHHTNTHHKIQKRLFC